MVLRGDLQDGITVAGMTVEMDWHDGLHAQAEILLGEFDLAAKACGVQIQSIRLDVAQDRSRTYMLDHMHSGAEGYGSGDDGISRAYSKRDKREVHRGRAGTQGERIRSMDELREVLLETFHLRPGRNPLRTKSVHNFVDFLFSNQRRGEGQEFIAHRLGMASATLNQSVVRAS